MSLKRFIRESREVRARFAEVLPKNDFPVKPILVAPPVKYSAQKASHIGTAFDYLLRFHLQRLNAPVVVTRRWIAEAALKSLEEATTWEISCYLEECVRDAAKARRIVDDARQQLANFLDSGSMSDSLVLSALNLATLDPIIRAGTGDEMIGEFDSSDIADVRRLIGAVDPAAFKANHLCLLNPSFNESPHFALGADADLVVDDVVIDIKTSQKFLLNRSDVDQLLGYFLLNELVGFSGVAAKPPITKVGIYFSRHAYLHTIPVREVITETMIAELLPWFQETAADYYPQDLDWKPQSSGSQPTQTQVS